MSRLDLSRRAILKGAARGALVSVALPRLHAMLDGNGVAYADGAPLPVRFGFWLWCGGIKRKYWIPETVGANWELKELSMPFAKVKPDIAMITGLAVKSRGAGHHQGLGGMLTGASPKNIRSNVNTTMQKASIDVDIASVIGKTTKFKSLQVGVLKTTYTQEGPTYLYTSFNGPDSFNPAEYSPAALFDRLFKGGVPAAPVANTPAPPARPGNEAQVRASVLDFVMQDAARLRMRVGSADRARLDQHLDGIRELEKRIEAAPAAVNDASCNTPPTRPTDPALDVLSTRSKLISDLLVYAFKCDLTRVFSMHFTSVHRVSFREVGITNNDFHGTTHDEPGEQPTVRKGNLFQISQLAYLFEQLQSTPEGAGKLIDNCAVMGTSELTEGVNHSVDDMPIVLAGKAGGKLRTGVHIRAKGDNASKVHLTIMRALGVPAAEYGLAEGRVTDSLAGLEV